MPKRKSTAAVQGIAMLLALAVIVNIALVKSADAISMYLGGASVNEADLEYDSAACFEEGTKVASAIQEEGSVLLKNAGGLLPLDQGTKVSILGAMSYNYVEGGIGAGEGVGSSVIDRRLDRGGK